MTSTSDPINIVLVYLGNKPPSYVKKNLNSLREEFPNAFCWLITDSTHVKKKFERLGHRVWLYQDNNKIWEKINKQMNFPKDFRNGFWFLTLKRFKALEDFAINNLGKILQVEADVILLPNFPLQYFTHLEKDLAFPIVGTGYAIASTMFIRNANAITELNKFIERISTTNHNSIDMTLLYEYALEFPERVLILPSGPSFKGDASGYFDGAAFGTYLLGQDPRNFRGFTLKYSPVDWHLDKINELEIEIVEGVLMVNQDGRRIPVYSLHNHSKKIDFFSNRKLLKELNRAIQEHKLGPKKVFAQQALFSILTSAIIRRLRRNRND